MPPPQPWRAVRRPRRRPQLRRACVGAGFGDHSGPGGPGGRRLGRRRRLLRSQGWQQQLALVKQWEGGESRALRSSAPPRRWARRRPAAARRLPPGNSLVPRSAALPHSSVFQCCRFPEPQPLTNVTGHGPPTTPDDAPPAGAAQRWRRHRRPNRVGTKVSKSGSLLHRGGTQDPPALPPARGFGGAQRGAAHCHSHSVSAWPPPRRAGRHAAPRRPSGGSAGGCCPMLGRSGGCGRALYPGRVGRA